MSTPNTKAALSEKLQQYLGYLETDPENLELLADSADLALKADQPTIALDLLERHSKLATAPTHAIIGMRGLALLQAKRFKEAVSVLQTVVEINPEDTSSRFNLAWCQSVQSDFEDALETLTDQTIKALPQAAALQIEILHQQEDFSAAGAAADMAMNTHPNDEALMATISVLALDLDQPELAAKCAAKAGAHPDALTTLGTLTLGENNPGLAIDQFEAALALNKHRPRAWIGKGLAQIATGDNSLRIDAANNIDSGAKLFATHIGSWIAAGWAHLLNNDLALSRQRFQTALDIDNTFSESHGAIAVLDMLEGNFESGQGYLRRAIGLDKNCFSAALAQVLLLESEGKSGTARQIFERAINTPIDDDGRTIAKALVKQGLGYR
jgi:tetratricopeptide (TPR) repeat protein